MAGVCCRKLPEKCSFTGLLPFIVGISARQISDIAAISGIRGARIWQLGVIGGLRPPGSLIKQNLDSAGRTVAPERACKVVGSDPIWVALDLAAKG
jgi:hypothetical protein